jgi:hypothetical protein
MPFWAAERLNALESAQNDSRSVPTISGNIAYRVMSMVVE